MTKTKLQSGDIAPDFELPNANNTPVKLKDYRNQKLLLYFYPAANTPGCTKEACDFRDNLALFNESKIQVLGISPDKPEKLAKFTQNYNLNFPLLSDPNKTTLTTYGAYGSKKIFAKTILGVIRSTFLIDETGKIQLALYHVKATGHVKRLLKELLPTS